MITLSTGLPGHGKTLFTIHAVNELAKKENRPVFYSGIPDLTLDWQEIDPEKWYEAPPGAIVVIDECQRIFRPRGNGSQVPEFVSKLETHRHQGLDLFFITQHPMLMDSNVRRLTERHFHICRKFGMHRATILQFESCKEQPLAKTSMAQRMEWKYPKEVFNYYKSSQVHTVKRRIPVQYFLMFLLPVLVAGVVWFFIQRHYQNGQIVIPGTQQTQPLPPVGGASATTTGGRGGDKAKPMTQAEYLAAHKPRIDGLAYTAPIYDEVTKPEEAPIPVACVESKKQGCKCYSQQATRLPMDEAICHQIVANGFFQSFVPKSMQKEPSKLEASNQPAKSAEPESLKIASFGTPQDQERMTLTPYTPLK